MTYLDSVIKYTESPVAAIEIANKLGVRAAIGLSAPEVISDGLSASSLQNSPFPKSDMEMIGVFRPIAVIASAAK